MDKNIPSELLYHGTIIGWEIAFFVTENFLV